MLILHCFTQLISVGFFYILVCVIFACFCDRCYARVVYVCVGWRFQNRGKVLLGYGRVCFGAFKISTSFGKK